MKFLRILFLLVSFHTFGQTLSPTAQVSILTISPGAELYSTFGHSAIRISDPVQMVDVNYNYGTFNFQESGFYLKFLRGYLNYMISSHNSYVEMEYWNRENRLITEQVLNLNQEQKQAIFDFLENNLKPENRYYRYKFFTDNCSTRLRDVLQNACGENLVFDETLNAGYSYRNWINIYAQNNGQEWADFGMNLAVGLGADKITGWSDAMFIPDNLMYALDKATIKTDSGKQSLVLKKHELNRIEKVEHNNKLMPLAIFFWLMIFVLVYTIYQIRKSKKSIVFDKIWFSILGIGGWILLILWFGTDHGVTEQNYNVIWVSPLVFPAILMFKNRNWPKKAFLLFAIIMVLGALILPFVTSVTWTLEVIFVMVISLIRVCFLLRKAK